MMQLLLERGADPKVVTASGVNALHAAVTDFLREAAADDVQEATETP